jgi:hypothetical protein
VGKLATYRKRRGGGREQVYFITTSVAEFDKFWDLEEIWHVAASSAY